MWRHQGSLMALGAILLFAVVWPGLALAADDTGNKEREVAGALFEKKDDWITVKADGEDTPVKYIIIREPDKELADALKTTFNASRVKLTYKKDGDARQLVSLKRQVLRASGTVTGEVINVYNDFWVEVKPKGGLSDAYAAGANYKDKEFMARLKGLKPGDSVTIDQANSRLRCPSC